MARLMVEPEVDYMRISRVGLTWLSDDQQLMSVLFKNVPNCQVNLVELNESDLLLRILHVFVDRYKQEWKIKGPAEVWRWHVEISPEFDDPCPQYCELTSEHIADGHRVRNLIEHVSGPHLVHPPLLSSELEKNLVPIAKCGRDLIPERDHYRSHSRELMHPGMVSEDLGILAEYENLMKIDVPQPRTWIM